MTIDPKRPPRTGQQDDNIDDLGRRPDGTEQDQPGVDFDDDSVDVEREEEDLTESPNPSPMNPAFP